MSYANAIQSYQKQSASAAVDGAGPHRLISMLLSGAVERLVAAKRAIDTGNVPQKGERISAAMGIIDGLRSSLDEEKGGEIAQNLAALYDYMNRRLLEANVKNDTAIVDEVMSLLREINEAWSAIAPDKPAPAPAAKGYAASDEPAHRPFSADV